MTHKYFPSDKNYILKEAQISAKKELLRSLVEKAKILYLAIINPLGLEDAFVLKIKNAKNYKIERLEEFYDVLAAIYRLKFGNTQLEILFDGRTHLEKYQQDWQYTFEGWTGEFCDFENFLKGVLELTILYPQDHKAQLAGARMKNFTSQFFELKIQKRKGFPVLKIA